MHVRLSLAGTLASCCAVLIGACAPPPPAPLTCDAPVAADVGAPTWHGEVSELLVARCGRCHRSGGIAPMPLQTYDEAFALREAVLSSVRARRMPPWSPSACCNRFAHDASLTADELATLEAWVAQGAPEGDPATAQPPEVPARGLPRVDREVQMPEPYTPRFEGVADDTRCFLIDWPEEEVRYVTGLDVHPGQRSQVHHVMVLIAAAADVPELQRQDAASDGPGWSCPGGLVTRYSGYLGGWSPGFDATTLPDGLGHRMLPDSKLVLTVHYSRPAAGQVRPDQTRVALMHQAERTTPVKSAAIYDPGWLVGGMHIPAGEPDVVFRYEYDPAPFFGGGSLLLHAANLHMHERGRGGMITLRRASGEDICLLQIDAYDHHWQGDYRFAEPIRAEPGDRLHIECRFDNTAGHQRIVAGKPEVPRDLNWGEEQEMCVGFVTVTEVDG